MKEDKVKARIVVEIAGTPKEHVEETMKMVIDKLKEFKGVKLLKETTYKAEQVEQLKGMWSSFSDLDIEVDNVEILAAVCFDFMPSSVEILKPEKLEMESKVIMDVFNDLLAKLHQYDMVVKNLNAENILLKKKQGK